MKRNNIILYSHRRDYIQKFLYDILSAENRVFMKDAVEQPIGTAVLDRTLTKHPSLKKTLYKPVDLIIIARADRNYIEELLKEIHSQDYVIKTLFTDSTMQLPDDFFEKWPHVAEARLLRCEKPEDVYFYEDITLRGNYKDYWKEFLEYNLFEPKITYG